MVVDSWFTAYTINLCLYMLLVSCCFFVVFVVVVVVVVVFLLVYTQSCKLPWILNQNLAMQPIQLVTIVPVTVTSAVW